MATLISYHEYLRSGLLHPRAQPLELHCGLALAALNRFKEGAITGTISGLPNKSPRDVTLGGHEIQIMQIA